MAVHDFNKVGRFQDRGCISCGEGSVFTPDQVLGVAETFSKKILSKTIESWEGPQFAIRNVPTKASMAVQPNAFSNRMSVFWPNLERLRWYDPLPTVAAKTVTKELINASGGVEGLDYNHFEGGGLACNPPLGPRALAGKDAAYATEVWTTLMLGPICTAKYRVLEDLAMYLSAAESGIGQALDIATQYEKINQFIQMSRKNVSAVAGQWQPNFSEHAITEYPTSPGSLEWAIHTAGVLGSRFPGKEDVKIAVSPQVLKFWIEDYVARHSGVQINLDFHTLKGQTNDFIASFTEKGMFSTRDIRTGRRVIFDTGETPIYLLLEKTGQTTWRYKHQPYFVYRAGDDNREGEMNGIMQDPNPGLGDPDQVHEDGSVLAELILIYSDSAFHYEAPPLNPFAGKFESGAIMPTIGTAQINWYTGVEVDEYFLKHMADPATGQCPNNRARQWIAGEVSQHLVIREDNKYAMGSMLIQVPSSATPLGAAPDRIPVAARPAPITLTAAPPIEATHCGDAPDAPEDQGGCLNVQLVLNAQANLEGNRTYQLWVERQGGFDGTLSLAYESVEDTALAGTHFTALSGTLTFAAGEVRKLIDVVILPYEFEDEEETPPVQFRIVWDGDLCSPYGGIEGYEDDSEEDIVTLITITPAQPAA